MRIRTYRVLSSTRLGYRGAFLLILAFIDFIYGWVLAHPAPEQRQGSAYVWRDHIMPTEWWGAVWVAVGVVLVVNAFMHQDRIGYGFAIGLKIGWAFIAAISGLTGNVQGAGSSVAIWAGFAVLTIMESGRPEPIRTHPVTIIETEPGGADL